jgi:outer membrane protein assembly factor BamD
MCRLRKAWIIVLSGIAASGCAELGLGESTRTINYSNTAKENYDRGLAALKSEDWLEAIKYFQFVRTKFGFSKWATLAELGIADANFGREKYQEAVDGYRVFAKSHPTHEMVQNGYAAFRIGESFYKEIPSEWFLVPPAYEKDQGPVKDAMRELSNFIEEFADSPYREKARKLVADCVKRLADHELYVADFYLGRNKPQAAVGRLEWLLKEYPNSQVEPQVLLLLGRTYMKMEKPKEARSAFERLIAAHPKDFHADKARMYLDFINKRWGARAVGNG